MLTRILFVCLGNICRSPAAEAIFRKMVSDKDIAEDFIIDSAGTGAWYEGEPADQRMQFHALKRGYQLTHLARKFKPEEDFDKFDLIIGMDNDIIRTLKAQSRNEVERKKILNMTVFNKQYGYSTIPDPFSGGEDGFELVMDLLEDACEGLLVSLKQCETEGIESR
jgi:protein-tyrosine phosphatase